MRYQIFFAILIYTYELNASASFSYSSSIVVCARRCGGYRIVAVPCRATCIAVLFCLVGRLCSISIWPYARLSRTAASAVRRSSCRRSHWHRLYQFLGDSLWVYVVAQVLVLWYMLITKTIHPPAGRQPYHHDLRPLQSIRALAAGFGWRAQPGCGGSHMEPSVSGPLALSCCLARPLPASLFWVGWNE